MELTCTTFDQIVFLLTMAGAVHGTHKTYLDLLPDIDKHSHALILLWPLQYFAFTVSKQYSDRISIGIEVKTNLLY